MSVKFQSPYNLETCLDKMKEVAPEPATVMLSINNKIAGKYDGNEVRLWFRGYRNAFAPIFTGKFVRDHAGSGTFLMGEFKPRPVAGLLAAAFAALAVYLVWEDLFYVFQYGFSEIALQVFSPLFLIVLPGFAWLVGRFFDEQLIRAAIIETLSVSKVEE